MEFNTDESRALSQEVSETKKNIIIVLFLGTFLLFWWLGDLIFPIFYDRKFGPNVYLVIFVTIFPLIINIIAWSVWGFFDKKIIFFPVRDFHMRNRDPFERFELSLIEFSKQKKIERLIYLLIAIQFITMGFLMIFVLMSMRIGLM